MTEEAKRTAEGDIVERLRSVDISWSEVGEWCAEAADEIERLRENAEQDAKYLLAYHRICEKHGFAPSSSDLMAALEGK